jgi:IrrE N-terminal-like domain
MSRALEFARIAARRALSFRLENGLPLDTPCDVYELICRHRLDLQFMDVPSLEGMYLDEPESRRICVCSHRPYGRQRFTAAHELAHCVFGHGTQIDAVLQEQEPQRGLTAEEFIADAFARYLLMPPRAVQKAFRLRNMDPARADAASTYRAACWLGVGYEALLNQMELSLKILSHDGHKRLSRTSPKAIRAEICERVVSADVWPLDNHWAGNRVHAQVGDIILGLKSPQCCHSQTNVSLVECGNAAFEAVGVGDGTALLRSDQLVRISVCRRAYVGFYDYRYMAE